MKRRASQTLVSFAVLTTALAGLVIGTQSCVFDNTETVTCLDGRICPPGWTCAADQDICILGGCGNGVVEPILGELCDDGNVRDNDGCSADCKALEDCGNDRLEKGEICDDGNNISGDGCSADCLSDEACGNGYRDIDELCDDGNNISGDGCSYDCRFLETCGNGDVDRGEICDDGNTDSGDGCSADCLSIEICGNGYKDVEEECDAAGDGKICDADCTLAVCGDRHPNPEFINPASGVPEECDDGDNTDECDRDCTRASCGDGFHNEDHIVNSRDSEDDQYTEQCDDGNERNTDVCVEGCKVAICGDGFTYEGVEGCDDGENNSNEPNACRGDCSLPTCGDEIVDDDEPFNEVCDDGNRENEDACPDGMGGTCKPAWCGDGFTWFGVEDCDDGNGSTSDDCPSGPAGTCEIARCRDGFVDQQGPVTEACDTGGDSLTCDFDCSLVECGDGYVNTAAGEQCDVGHPCGGLSECVLTPGQPNQCTCP